MISTETTVTAYGRIPAAMWIKEDQSGCCSFNAAQDKNGSVNGAATTNG